MHRIIHLGHVIHDDIFKSDASKCISDFNTQCNIFFADFKNSSSFIRNQLFLKYCTSFYGVQFLPIYDRKLMKDLYVAWRMAVRRVWKVPWTTHSNLLPHLAGVMPPELAFAKRTISFIRLLLNSNNQVVRTITGMGLCGSHSIIGQNYRYLSYKYDMDIKILMKSWDNICQEQHDIIRVSDQIKELCNMRDSYQDHLLSRDEIKSIIVTLCTE